VVTAQSILTIAASGFLAVGGIAAITSFARIFRLRRDAKWIEAAERYEHVDLQYLSKRYVPLDQMTGLPTTEMPIMKGNVAAYLGFWWRLFGVSMALCIIAGAFVIIGIERELAAARLEAERRAAGPPEKVASVNPLADILGVWGTPFDFERSCAQNPRTITLADGGRRLVMQFAKPLGGIPQTLEFAIVDVQANAIFLKDSDNHIPADGLGLPLRIKIVLDDKNTYRASRSDLPTQTGPIIGRCPAS
jgi:hypothetical protein